VTFKMLALSAMIGLASVSVQASELPNGPHVVTSGTASVSAVPDMATLAIVPNGPLIDHFFFSC